jgi:RNA polymerase sigma factor (sigma-70 family)
MVQEGDGMDETKRDSPEDLHDFANALVKKMIRSKGLDWDEHRIEDAVQELFLAGWQVWCNTEDVGLAKNRMASRRKNLIRDFFSEKRHEPKPESDFERVGAGDGEAEQADWLERREAIRGSPTESAEVNDFLDHLPDRRRDICRYRMAGYANKEIARELDISERTVERELIAIRKECEDEFGND